MTENDDPLGPIISRLKEPVKLAPDLTDRIMAEVAATRPEWSVVAPRPWWRRRWTVQVTPFGGFAAAAGLAAFALGVWTLARRPSAGPEATTVVALDRAAPDLSQTQFLLVAPNAARVAVVGDFNDWNAAATPLVRAEGEGIWSVTVPLRPGRYRYAFVVDGTVWRPDPEAPALDDEFGRPSSVVTIGGA